MLAHRPRPLLSQSHSLPSHCASQVIGHNVTVSLALHLQLDIAWSRSLQSLHNTQVLATAALRSSVPRPANCSRLLSFIPMPVFPLLLHIRQSFSGPFLTMRVQFDFGRRSNRVAASMTKNSKAFATLKNAAITAVVCRTLIIIIASNLQPLALQIATPNNRQVLSGSNAAFQRQLEQLLPHWI
jgi:hypothetical protein